MKALQPIQPGTEPRARQGQIPDQVREPKRWLTQDEAIAHLNLGSRTALYRLIREWRLPYGRIGNRFRFDPVALDRWVERRGESSVLRRA